MIFVKWLIYEKKHMTQKAFREQTGIVRLPSSPEELKRENLV